MIGNMLVGHKMSGVVAGCPHDIYRLMCECWNPTPADRPSFATMFDRLQRFLQVSYICCSLYTSRPLRKPNFNLSTSVN
jgi:hypothetical protein